jgi:4-amino-4-deoxy-L-arabinose transferase-like glycosyltransferase
MKRDVPVSTIVLAAILLLAGFLLRLVLYEVPMTSDARSYMALASRLARGEGFVAEDGRPTAYRAPLYPFFLSVVVGDNAKSIFRAYVVQSLISLLSCLLVASLAGFLFDRTPKWTVLILSVFYLPFVYYSKAVLPETLFVFLLLGAFFGLVRSVRTGKTAWAAPAGILMGLAALTKASAVLVLGLLPLWPLAERKEEGKRKALWKSVFLFELCAAAAIAPWTVRNALRFDGSFIPVSSQGPASLWLGLHPPRQGFGFSNWEEAERVRESAGEAQRKVGWNRFFLQDSLRTLREEPATVLKLEVVKLFYFFTPFDGGRTIPFSDYNLFFGLVLSLAAVSLRTLSRASPAGRLPYFVLGVFLLNGLLFTPVPRYRLGAEGLLLAATGPALVPEKRKWAGALLAANLLLLVFSPEAKEAVKTVVDHALGYSNLFH